MQRYDKVLTYTSTLTHLTRVLKNLNALKIIDKKLAQFKSFAYILGRPADARAEEQARARGQAPVPASY